MKAFGALGKSKSKKHRRFFNSSQKCRFWTGLFSRIYPKKVHPRSAAKTIVETLLKQFALVPPPLHSIIGLFQLFLAGSSKRGMTWERESFIFRFLGKRKNERKLVGLN